MCCALAILSVTCGFTTLTIARFAAVWLAISAAIALRLLTSRGFFDEASRWFITITTCFPVALIAVALATCWLLTTRFRLIATWLRITGLSPPRPGWAFAVLLLRNVVEPWRPDFTTLCRCLSFKNLLLVLSSSLCHQLGAFCPCWSVLSTDDLPVFWSW